MSEKQRIQRKRNWEKARIFGMKASISTMFNDKEVFTEREREHLTLIKDRLEFMCMCWVNKR